MARKKKQTVFVDPTLKDTVTIDLGPAEDYVSYASADIPFNFVCIHRHDELIMQKWGNFCNRIMSKILWRDVKELPIKWYHRKIYNFCSNQYNKYGDYYRLIDNTFGTATDDIMWEEQ